MSGEYELHAVSRSNLGTSASRRARAKQGRVIGVVYGGELTSNLHIEVDHKELEKKLRNQAFYAHIINLHVDNQTIQVVLKALQRHPFRKQILHMDLLQVSAKDRITMNVPIRFVNESKAPGVKKGGVISHHATTIEVTCLPSQLPEFITVDVANLELDQSIHLSEIQLPTGLQSVELGHHNDAAVVSIHIPRASADTNETPVTPAEPEVIKEKKKSE